MRRHSPKAHRGPARDDAPLVDINTTPLIDVMLVLLIMLIITIPIQLHSVNLNMPTGSPPPSALKPEVLRIDVDAASVVLWDGEALTTREELERRMAREAERAVQPEVHLRPDRKARYEVVAAVLASAQRLGLSKIGVVGSEQFVR
ncbi:ExbD/TolR family protein [Aquabacterium sp. J223]|uniref:ExbD/TolR family protein n=1 Tax=Aquabacterium sp. J223 TaxID=2898431 RepID=UPI0021AD8461|nr:biopolymer transporter ExbD [Aquabacterium sp. J223]UUX96402.1 biopolymer transporter ExbD [Aquabacterium sp. J223]